MCRIHHFVKANNFIDSYNLNLSQSSVYSIAKPIIMKKISLVLAILVSLYAGAQHAGNADYNGSYTPNFVPHAQVAGVNLNVTVAGYSYGNMVSLKGDMMMNVLPSSYIIIMSATQVNETFEKADSMLNQRFGILRNELKRLGITDQDIHIDFIS